MPFLKFLVFKRWFSNSLLLPALPHFSWFCQFSIAKIQKWGSVSNRGRVPQSFKLLGQCLHLVWLGISPKTQGTLPLFDKEPHFWIFAMLNWQDHEKWAKTGKSRLLENHLLSTRNFKNGILSSKYYINFPKKALTPKSGIFTIYTCCYTVHCSLFLWIKWILDIFLT